MCGIYYINGTRRSVTEVGALYGHRSCGWLLVIFAWRHATVGSGHGWLGADVARNFPSASLAGRGRCVASSWVQRVVHLDWGLSSRDGVRKTIHPNVLVAISKGMQAVKC